VARLARRRVSSSFNRYGPSRGEHEPSTSAIRMAISFCSPGEVNEANRSINRSRTSRILLIGTGVATFRAAAEALERWQMATLGWSSIVPRLAPVAPGITVAVRMHHYGFWSLNACRIVYRLDETTDGVRRLGFAYGTLPAHGAIGEERFSVEWHEVDDSVWYDLYAFSRPGSLLAWLGYPLARRLQRRFARASMRAMAGTLPAGEVCLGTPDQRRPRG
jgi:uncharacterized protein (UPF0548 family)